MINMDNCDCKNLDAYLDGDLAPGDSARFADHLDECPNCREAVDTQQWIDGLLRSPAITQLEMPSSALVESCRTSLARRRKLAHFAGGGVAAAAAVFLAVGWTQLNRQAVDPGAPLDIHVAASQSVVEASAPTPQIATFVGDADCIVVPVVSNSPNVTIVRIYPTIEPDFSANARAEDLPATDELAWPESFSGG